MSYNCHRISWRKFALQENLINFTTSVNPVLRRQLYSSEVKGAKIEGHVSKQIASNKSNTNKNSIIRKRLRDALSMPIRAYGQAQSRRPYTTQIVSSLFIYAIGDLAAQYIEFSRVHQRDTGGDAARDVGKHSRMIDRLDTVRLVRTMIIGAIVSVPGYRWMMYLSSHFNLKSKPATVAYKILINQFVWSPFIGVYFFSMQSLLSGQTIFSTWERVVQTVPITWQNSWKFWPFVMAVNLTLIKPQNRSIFAICAGIVWQTYLCMVNQKEVERTTWQQAQGSSVAA